MVGGDDGRLNLSVRCYAVCLGGEGEQGGGVAHTGELVLRQAMDEEVERGSQRAKTVLDMSAWQREKNMMLQ